MCMITLVAIFITLTLCSVAFEEAPGSLADSLADL